MSDPTTEHAPTPRASPAGSTWRSTTSTPRSSFYGGLFGWTFETATPPGVPPYLIAQLDGEDAAGLGGPPPQRERALNRWNTYIAVDDLEATLRVVEEVGGQVVDPVEQAGEGGWNATVADPAGIEVRLWQAKRRLGAQVSNLPGAWNFSDLHTDDPEGAKRFYGSVFGWVFVDLGFGDDDPGAGVRRPPRRHRRPRHPRATGLGAARVRRRDRWARAGR